MQAGKIQASTQFISDYTRVHLADKTIRDLHRLINTMEHEQRIKQQIAIWGLAATALLGGLLALVRYLF